MLSTAHSPLRPLSAAIVLLSFSTACWAGEGAAVFGIPVDFILFALTLLGVALFHHHTLRVALIGLATITLYKLGFSDFHGVAGIGGRKAGFVIEHDGFPLWVPHRYGWAQGARRPAGGGLSRHSRQSAGHRVSSNCAPGCLAGPGRFYRMVRGILDALRAWDRGRRCC